MSESTRAVLDTNVVLAARRSPHATSPNAEIIDRWEAGEFVLLCTPDIILEYAEKLAATGASPDASADFLAAVALACEWVRIDFFHVEHYPPDGDDVAFLLCALNGEATHLVTYDGHLLALQPHYPLAICEPLRFLADLRRP